jgi:hypothetical protein
MSSQHSASFAEAGHAARTRSPFVGRSRSLVDGRRLTRSFAAAAAGERVYASVVRAFALLPVGRTPGICDLFFVRHRMSASTACERV